MIPSTGGSDDSLRFKIRRIILVGEVAKGEGESGSISRGSVGRREWVGELVMLVSTDSPRSLFQVDKDGVTARMRGDAMRELDVGYGAKDVG